MAALPLEVPSRRARAFSAREVMEWRPTPLTFSHLSHCWSRRSLRPRSVRFLSPSPVAACTRLVLHPGHSAATRTMASECGPVLGCHRDAAMRLSQVQVPRERLTGVGKGCYEGA